MLKANESEVNEVVEEIIIGLGGPLALMSKVSSREAEKETVEKEGSSSIVMTKLWLSIRTIE